MLNHLRDKTEVKILGQIREIYQCNTGIQYTPGSQRFIKITCGFAVFFWGGFDIFVLASGGKRLRILVEALRFRRFFSSGSCERIFTFDGFAVILPVCIYVLT